MEKTQQVDPSPKRRVALIAVGVFFVIGVVTSIGLLIQKNRSFRPQNSPSSPTMQQTPTPPTEKQSDILDVSEGKVTLTHEGQTKTISTGERVPLAENDKITTDVETIAFIRYNDDTFVRLAPETTVVFHQTKDFKTTVENQGGSIFVRFKKLLGVVESFEVETPTAVATVRGTAFAVWYRSDKTSRISVVEDIVDVIKKDENGKRLPETKISVPQENKADVHPKKEKPTVVTKLTDTDEEQKWIRLNKEIDDEREKKKKTLCPSCRMKNEDEEKIVSTVSAKFLPKIFTTPTSAPTKPPTPIIQSMPGEGYSYSLVKTDTGDFPLSCIGANKSNLRVITDSVSDNNCTNNCPVMSLADYATRNGGFAAINGMYFCPAEYSACAGKTNSFDTLFFNSKAKRYINSDNNVYSTLPFFIFSGDGTPIFKSRTLDWGRDTGIGAGTAGNPLLVQNGKALSLNQLDTKQKTAKIGAGAIVQKGDMLYLCIVGQASVLDAASVYTTLKADNAMNIDGGGSAAMWYNGSYVYGPGRNIPTAIIFARK